MADKKSPETPKKRVAAKIFDDVKPANETPATATSKPVITGHMNTIKRDPMVAPLAEDNKDAEPKLDPEVEKEKIVSKPRRELKIEPISKAGDNPPVDDEITDNTEEAEDTKGLDTDNVVEDSITEKELVTEDKAEETEISKDEEEKESSDSATIDAIVDNVSTKKERDEQNEKEQLIENEVNGLIDSKKYNVKISDTPSKRQAKLLVILLIVLIVAASGWYFALGPGKNMWLNSSEDQSSSSQPSVTPNTNSSNSTPTANSDKITFTNSNIKLSFSYPKTWKVNVDKDSAQPKFDVITLVGPNESIESVTSSSVNVKADTFFRAKIFIENTKNTTDYSTKLSSLTNCSSEDIVVNNANLKLIFSGSQPSGNGVSKVSLSPEVCTPIAKLFNAKDQLQFATKQNTYVIYGEYVFSDTYLESLGTKSPDAVKTAQSSGVVTSKDSFKSTATYKSFVDVLKTIKEL